MANIIDKAQFYHVEDLFIQTGRVTAANQFDFKEKLSGIFK